MRIAHTPPRYAPHIGGVEAVDQVVAEHGRRHGDDVVVLCADEPRGAPTSVNGVPVRRLPWRRKVANTHLTPGLVRALWTEPWDVVHTHLPTPWTADVSVAVARLRRRRSVLHFHNPIVGDGTARWVAAAYRATLERLTMRLADAVIVISPTRRDQLVAAHPGIRGKLHLIPNGVDLHRFTPPAGPPGNDLLFVSVLDAFHDYKGLSDVLRALVDVPDAVLHVVGDGSGRSRWQREAEELGVGDRVRWPGAVTDAELLHLYRTCGTFVLASWRAEQEGGSSLVALEAMACGLPVVLAAGVGDLAAQADAAGAGIAVASNDVPALAKALRALTQDADLRRGMGQRARAHVEEHHSWEVACDRIRALYAG